MVFDDVKNWIQLSLFSGIGPSLFVQLVQSFDDPARVLKASEQELASKGFSSAVFKILQNHPNKFDETGVKKLLDNGVHFLNFYDSNYPARLKQIASFPPYLFVKGNLNLLNQEKMISIVGTREPTAYGLAMTQTLTRDLANLGFVIVSGFALGIDIAAHKTCFELKLPNIAVMAHGLDMVAPSSHQKFASELLQSGGAFVTEYLPGVTPFPANFPRRNRIISGLTRGVIVVEAKERSGALITARYALDQNRDVFAVPGDARSEYSKGPHKLIQQGAQLITSADDVLKEWDYPRQINLPLEKKKKGGSPLLDLITEGFQTVDQLVSHTKQSPEAILIKLTQLELDGRVTILPGGRFSAL